MKMCDRYEWLYILAPKDCRVRADQGGMTYSLWMEGEDKQL